ncbi:hypothetical protein AVL55_05025 [Alteromonas macleodii]|uniref:Glycosyl transferase family 1 domain-containing protein n=1 Tax=Alteromonas macleodii TaxID=28108 RepID=A0A126PZC3_ALTMA|nr:glycosyltransferase [Alteromonas macleodii]AMJ97578.1 hypothetical protein AVL55_05025 [Alteromonas macleodii]
MKVLLICRINEHSKKFAGVFKKIKGQLEGFEQAGCDVGCVYMSYGTQTTSVYHAGELVNSGLCWTDISSQQEPVIFWQHAVEAVEYWRPDVVWVRYEPMLKSPTLVEFFRAIRARAVTCVEFPTYPYEAELPGVDLKPVRTNRKAMLEQVDHVFSTCYDDTILNKPNYPFDNQLSQAIIDELAGRRASSIRHPDSVINLLVVANLSSWHGIDRVIEGLAAYYTEPRQTTVMLHVVGDGDCLQSLQRLCSERDMEEAVKFYGFLTGSELDKLFIKADIAIGSLGMHRIDLFRSSTLKVREYLASGLPVIYSCADSVLMENPYTLRIPEDDSALDISQVVAFFQRIQSAESVKPAIAAFARDVISWRGVAENILNVVKGDLHG